MALIFGVCAAIGMVLGWRSKVLVLVPSTFLVVCGVAVIGAAVGWKVLLIVGVLLGAVVALQIGYLLGIAACAATRSVFRREHGQIATARVVS
jgi:hypothetical protein